MSWLNLFHGSKSPARTKRLSVELLEDRLVPSSADLIAYRPVTQYFNYANYPIAAAQEESPTLGPGIRYNGDDDNGNLIPDYNDTSATGGADNDMIRVNVAATGTSAVLTYTPNLEVWTAKDNGTSQVKLQKIDSGSTLFTGTVWVEYQSLTHTDAANTYLMLTANDGPGTPTTFDTVVFHSFRSVVIAIGGNTQNPANVGDPNLGIFTIASNLYQQGYDPHLFAHDQISSNSNNIGAGAAYNEVASAVTQRNAKLVGIIGYSWGGGATYELAKGLQTNLAGQYTLAYTAYIDGITHGWISSERRLPPGTAYHDNIFQRKDWLLKGNTVTNANTNINVTITLWGKNLTHTTIDNNLDVQNTIIWNMNQKLSR
jgi:hypothetical protein